MRSHHQRALVQSRKATATRARPKPRAWMREIRAVAGSPSTRTNAIERRLIEITGGPVVVETRVDGGILGGLVVRIGDRLIDGSTMSKLRALKTAIGGGART